MTAMQGHKAAVGRLQLLCEGDGAPESNKEALVWKGRVTTVGRSAACGPVSRGRLGQPLPPHHSMQQLFCMVHRQQHPRQCRDGGQQLAAPGPVPCHSVQLRLADVASAGLHLPVCYLQVPAGMDNTGAIDINALPWDTATHLHGQTLRYSDRRFLWVSTPFKLGNCSIEHRACWVQVG